MSALVDQSELAQTPVTTIRRLLSTRRHGGFDRYDMVILLLYAAILAFAIHHYLPFSDEGQGWVMARDCSLGELLFRRLHYEGHPGLWATFLWCLCRLNVPFQAMNWIGGSIAVAGIYVFLRFSPFPRIFRYLLPFTYFLQYQYAAVARPYVAFPLLLFTLCILFTLDRPRPRLFAVVAGIMANLSLHAAIIAGVFFLLFLFDLSRTQNLRKHRRSTSIAIAIFAALLLCAGVVSFPAPDAATAFRPDHRISKPHALTTKLVPEERLPASAPPLDPSFKESQGKANNDSKRFAILFQSAYTLSALFYPIAQFNAIAGLFVVCLARWLWRRGCLRLLLPSIAAVIISTRVFVFDHHTGQFALAMLAAMWICLASETNRARIRIGPQWNEPVFVAVCTIVVFLQIGWTYHCISEGARSPTDPGKATEAYLLKTFPNKRVAGFTFESVSAQPYSSKNLFANQATPYRIWSVNLNMEQRRTEALRGNPDAVVVGVVTVGDQIIFDQIFDIDPAGTQVGKEMVRFWQQHGYVSTQRICGTQFRRMGTSYSICEVILKRAAAEPGFPRAN